MIAVSPDYPDGEDVVDGLTFCNRTLGFVNAPALMQHILARLQDVTIDVGEYESSRDFLHSALTDIGYSVVRPEGAFYMFPRSPIEDDVAFVDQLKQHRVLVVPGAGFGTPGHFRISFCVTEATLQGSLEGFRQAFNAARE
jgi:aspartate aminotransferase